MSLLSSIQKFPGTIHYIECEEEEDKQWQKIFVLGALCAQSVNKTGDEVYFVSKNTEREIPAKDIFPKLTYKTASTLSQVFGKRGTGRQKSDKTIIKKEERKKSEQAEETNPPENQKKKRARKASGASNTQFLNALKEINPNYPFEANFEQIMASVRNSFADCSFDMMLRMNCGQEEADKLFEMLKPHFNTLKNLV